MTEPVWERYRAFLERTPEVTFSWADRKTDARGWMVINSLRGGAAGGGTRMHRNASVHEARMLAKTMEVKFTVTGPAIGGAKSTIRFDPRDPRKDEVLGRWFTALAPLLKAYYGTGGDLNVDEVQDVIPITLERGILHPQEGIVRGGVAATATGKQRILAQLSRGVEAPLTGSHLVPGAESLNVADMITGYGVARATIALYRAWGVPIAGRRVLVQGFGAVGAGAAWYLAREGALIVGIIDGRRSLAVPEGLSPERLATLIATREDKCLPPGAGVDWAPSAADPAGLETPFFQQPAEIFVPAARSEVLDARVRARLDELGVKVIAPGANNPYPEIHEMRGEVELRKPDLDLLQAEDARLTIIPDFVANAGMARAFAFLMREHQGGWTVEELFRDVDEMMTREIESVAGTPWSTGMMGRALGQALDQIEEG